MIEGTTTAHLATGVGANVGAGGTDPPIREMRERLGLRRVDLAIRSDVALTTLANFESGLIPQKSEALKRVLGVLEDLGSLQQGST